MQGICHLSRRWHQQFCHSPSFGPHKSCFHGSFSVSVSSSSARHYRATRKSRPAVKPQQTKFQPFDDHEVESDPPPQRLTEQELMASISPAVQFADTENPEIKQWEQIGNDKSTRRPVAPDNSLRKQAEKIWARIQKTDEELKRLDKEEKEESASDLYGPNSPLVQSLPPEHRAEFLKVLEQHGFGQTNNEEEDSLDLAEIERLSEGEKEDQNTRDNLQVALEIPRSHQVLVKRFNKALADVQEDPDDVEKNLGLWKWYLRCQQRVPAFGTYIAEKIWDALWDSQVNLGARPQHMAMLGSDMIKADVQLSLEQELDFLRALHACGNNETAQKRWEALRPEYIEEANPDLLTVFYGLGVELCVASKKPRDAQELAMAGIEHGASPSILLHAIIGWARSQSPYAASKAFAAYLNMRSRLGKDMTPQLYEQVSDALLGEKRTELALAVFKDLIQSIKGTGAVTLDTYERALGSVSASGSPEEVEHAINQVSLSMMLALPRANHNKFFFASWIKKLIGQGQLDSAAMVVELMYERRIKPDAMHLNGLIGAWLRSNDAEQREKAVTLAREMIQVRVEAVANRRPRTSQEDTLVRNIFSGSIPQNRPIPAANHETFRLLFDYYTDRRQWTELDTMHRLMTGPAQLPTNAMIMNKFLLIELEARALQRFWHMFERMGRECVPNLETYMLVWQALNVSATSGKTGVWSSPRQVFAKIMDWSTRLPHNKLQAARRDFDSHAYSTIIRTLCAHSDWAGLLCGMQGMYEVFGATPDDTSVQLMMNLAARALPRLQAEPGTSRARRRGDNYRQDMTLLRTITDMVGELEMQRQAQMVHEGLAQPKDFDDHESATARKLRLDVMSEFVVVVMKRMEKDNSNLHKTLRDVAKVMHVDITHLDIDRMLE